jgi:hypothetical protein
LPSYKWGGSPDSRWRKICVFWHSWGVFFPWFYCFGDSVLLLDMKNPKYPTKIIFVDDFFGVLCFIHVFTSWKNTKGGGGFVGNSVGNKLTFVRFWLKIAKSRYMLCGPTYI